MCFRIKFKFTLLCQIQLRLVTSREIRSIGAISLIIQQYSKSEFQKISFVLFLFQIKNLIG
jgi:hypothetical protein